MFAFLRANQIHDVEQYKQIYKMVDLLEQSAALLFRGGRHFFFFYYSKDCNLKLRQLENLSVHQQTHTQNHLCAIYLLVNAQGLGFCNHYAQQSFCV